MRSIISLPPALSSNLPDPILACDCSFAAMSAALLCLAKCCVSAALVAPPATPVTARARLPRHAMARKARGKSGDARSMAMAGQGGGEWRVKREVDPRHIAIADQGQERGEGRKWTPRTFLVPTRPPMGPWPQRAPSLLGSHSPTNGVPASRGPQPFSFPTGPWPQEGRSHSRSQLGPWPGLLPEASHRYRS